MIQAPIALGQVHFLAARIAVGIGPDLVVKPDCFDNECISVPPANRVPEPTGVGIFRKLSPVSPDGAPNVILLEEHQHPPRNLDDLKWVGKSEKAWRARGVTAQDRI